MALGQRMETCYERAFNMATTRISKDTAFRSPHLSQQADRPLRFNELSAHIRVRSRTDSECTERRHDDLGMPIELFELRTCRTTLRFCGVKLVLDDTWWAHTAHAPRMAWLTSFASSARAAALVYDALSTALAAQSPLVR